ncbi:MULTISPECIES: asparaginase [unclassified Haloferax]|uniref:Asparaginase n=1 Tax=Haloferax sp. Atlit-48N TaxID=2077198 RepID=A0ACD5I0T8_9EURY|nr:MULTISPECIES: asparaginase [unclassified Haloferax]RDZ30315.1 L-asparaginase [Haloferax sp. Atlit-48N]RDZ34067.1 L-asparaginase [Haloferax sp. Atlit-24N]RLM33672.1 asparaginase [Haloferax sp. Atlit-109R]RLM40747.1 asparaginase [Haloferax sp. Atlit-105R]
MPPQVTVLSTGGTIASTDGEGGATPSKRGAALVDAVPELGEYAEVEVRDVALRPSFDMDFETVAATAHAARDAAVDGADGVVVTHGTDTMEESAYYLDLALDLDVPVVFTGAQRRPNEVSADGPSNLLTAVRAAVDESFTGRGGVYVAFDEQLHAARDATKIHTSDLDAFASPDASPVARFTREGTRLLREPGSRSASVDAIESSKDVAVVQSYIGADDRQLRSVVEAEADGVVLEGTGLGNATNALGEAAGSLAEDGYPVVVTTRCQGGAVAPVYGSPGGGETLRDRRVIDGSDLPAHKARIKLMLVLESVGDDLAAIRAAFE